QAAESDDRDRFLALSSDFVRRYPSIPLGHAAHADALSRLGEFDSALRAIDVAEELGLDDTEIRMIRDDIYDEMGMTAKAIQEFTFLAGSEVARSNPEFHVIVILGRARQLRILGDLEQALRDANTAIGIMPDPSAYATRGHIYYDMNEFEKCLIDYNRALQLDPDNPDHLDNRARVYERLERTDKAESDRSAIGVSELASAPAATSETRQTSKTLAAPPPPPQQLHHPPAPQTAASPPSHRSDLGPARAATGDTPAPSGAVQYRTSESTRNTALVLVGCALVLVVASIAAAAVANITSAGTNSANASSSTVGQGTLEQIRQADRNTIESSLLETWVPQVAAAAAGDNGMLSKHQNLKQRYGALLLRSDDYNFAMGRGYWVSVAPFAFPSARQALAWCRTNNLGPDDCFAKFLTHDLSVGDTVEYQ
ncbi:MAG: tetratricopeptide repeat protein, partial [Pseudonocardia sp.]